MQALRRIRHLYATRWGDVLWKNLPVALAAGLLTALPWCLMGIARQTGTVGQSAVNLLTLLTNLLLRPVGCAVMVICMARRWEGRPAGFAHTVRFLRMNFLRFLLTGMAAWAAAECLGMILGLIPAIAGLADVLLGWIPGIGSGTQWLHGLVSRCVEWVSRFGVHLISVWFMLPLTGDKIRPAQQIRKGLQWMWGGRPDSFWAIGFIAAGWCVCLWAGELLSGIPGIMALVGGLLLPLSASAVLCMLLSERDRQDGIRLRIYVEE